VNFKIYPNIYGEDKELTQKVQKVDEFIQEIKKKWRKLYYDLSPRVRTENYSCIG